MKITIELVDRVDWNEFAQMILGGSKPPVFGRLISGDIIHDSLGREFIAFPKEGWKHERIEKPNENKTQAVRTEENSNCLQFVRGRMCLDITEGDIIWGANGKKFTVYLNTPA